MGDWGPEELGPGLPPATSLRLGQAVAGVTGIEIEIGDSAAIVDAVTELLDSPTKCAQMGKNGRKFAEDRFEQKQFIHRLIQNRLNLLGIQQ